MCLKGVAPGEERRSCEMARAVHKVNDWTRLCSIDNFYGYNGRGGGAIRMKSDHGFTGASRPFKLT